MATCTGDTVMNQSERKPLLTFFRVNMIAGLLVMAGVMLVGLASGAPAEGLTLRVALAALLYSLFAAYADLYFRPLPARKM